MRRQEAGAVRARAQRLPTCPPRQEAGRWHGAVIPEVSAKVE